MNLRKSEHGFRLIADRISCHILIYLKGMGIKMLLVRALGFMVLCGSVRAYNRVILGFRACGVIL